MNLLGLGATELLTLFGIFGGSTVLLYLLKLRRRRVEVPYSPLWARVVDERRSSSLISTLKRLFSLLVQLAVVALLVLALGDPRADRAGCSPEEAGPPLKRHTLLLIDASASMDTWETAGNTTRLKLAKARAHAIVDAIEDNPDHAMMVVQFDVTSRPLSVWRHDAAGLHAAIDAVGGLGGVAFDTPTAIGDALALAAAALRGRQDPEVVLLTDNAFPRSGPAAASLKAATSAIEAAGARLVTESVGTPAANVGISAFNVRPYLSDRLSYAAFFAVTNHGDTATKATLHLYANPAGRGGDDFKRPDQIIASHSLELAAGEHVEGVIDDLKFEGSRVAARLVLDGETPDRFGRDDLAFAVVPERRKVKVQLVTDGNLFLNATLFLRENVALTTVTPSEYQGPAGFDVTVVDRADVDVSAPGDYFLIGVPPRGPFELETATPTLTPRLGKVKRDHPLMKHLTFVDIGIESLPRVKKARGDVVVAATTTGEPVLMTRALGPAAGNSVSPGARYVLLPFDTRKSLLPMSYAFPLLVVNVLNHFVYEEAGLIKPNRAGVELSLPWPVADGEVSALGPAGASQVYPRLVGERVHLLASRVGIYELRGSADPGATGDSNNEVFQAVAVNLLSPRESAVSPESAVDDSGATWTAPAYEAPQPTPWLADLWRVLLLVALGIVVVEWWTYHRRVTV